jgi:hypothetical protein
MIISNILPDYYILNKNGTAYVRCNPLLCDGVSLDPTTRIIRALTEPHVVRNQTPKPAGFGNQQCIMGAILYSQPCEYEVFYERGAT